MITVQYSINWYGIIVQDGIYFKMPEGICERCQEERYILKDAKKKAEGYENIDFIFVDLNCRLGLKKLDGTFKFFNNDSELESILNDDELPDEESE